MFRKSVSAAHLCWDSEFPFVGILNSSTVQRGLDVVLADLWSKSAPWKVSNVKQNGDTCSR